MGGLHDIAVAVGPWEHGIAKAPPLLWKLRSEAASKDPVELTAQASGDAEEDEFGDPIWIGLSVGKCEGTAPRATDDEPALDREVISDALDIGDEVVGGVRGQIDVGGAGMGRAATAVPLVVEDDAVAAGIEEAAMPRGAAGAWAAVKNEGGLALGMAAGFPVEPMSVADVE
jgi:hypothetical protein